MGGDEFGAAAGWTLNDSPVRLLITSKGIDTHPWYFVRDNPKNSRKTGKLGVNFTWTLVAGSSTRRERTASRRALRSNSIGEMPK